MSKFAKKSLGQNFLIDPNYQNKIIQSVQTDYEGETIIEIGPGRGALTKHLITFAKKLILIEKDNLLAKNLDEQFSHLENVSVIHKDVLKLDFTELGSDNIVVGNLPYNISSQIYIQLLIHNQYFKKLYLMFQKEVAMRCVAKPGTKDYGILTIWTQLFSQAHKLFHLPPNVFLPRPKVTSTFVEFIMNDRSYEDEKEFIDFIKFLFSQRRKKISTLLKSRKYMFESVSHLADQRAEALTLAELKQIFASI